MIGSPDLPKNPKTAKKLKTIILARKFFKRPKKGYYGKNQKKLKEYFGEMGQKTAKLGQKNQI